MDAKRSFPVAMTASGTSIKLIGAIGYQFYPSSIRGRLWSPCASCRGCGTRGIFEVYQLRPLVELFLGSVVEEFLYKLVK